jgi:hypothetical protein
MVHPPEFKIQIGYVVRILMGLKCHRPIFTVVEKVISCCQSVCLHAHDCGPEVHEFGFVAC